MDLALRLWKTFYAFGGDSKVEYWIADEWPAWIRGPENSYTVWAACCTLWDRSVPHALRWFSVEDLRVTDAADRGRKT